MFCFAQEEVDKRVRYLAAENAAAAEDLKKMTAAVAEIREYTRNVYRRAATQCMEVQID